MVRQRGTTISQATFDAAVRDAMEDFDMGLDEAVEEARTQFALAGGADLHHMMWSGSNTSKDEAQLVAALSSLTAQAFREAALRARADDGLRRRMAVSEPALQAAVTALARQGDQECQTAALALIHSICSGQGAESSRLLLSRMDGVKSIRQILVTAQDISPLTVEALKAAHAAILKVESSKVLLCVSPSLDCILRLMQKALDCGTETENDRSVLRTGCLIIKTLLAPDDNTTATTEAFPRARVLAGCPTAQSSGLATLKIDFSTFDVLIAIVALPNEDDELCADALGAIRSMAISDSICADLVDRGVVQLMTSLLLRDRPNLNVCRAALGLLRNLAGRDETKDAVCQRTDEWETSPLNAVLSTMTKYGEDASVTEQCCGVIAAVTLRRPRHAESVTARGGLKLIIDAMEAHGQSIPVVKAACLAIRNLAARSSEVKAVVSSDRKLELLLRAVEDPASKEVARSALFECGWLADSELRTWDRKV